MFNKLLITGMFILFACGPGDMASKVQAADKQCMTMEQGEFLKSQEKYIKNGVYATPEELKIFVDLLNLDRVKNGRPIFEADTMYVADLGGDRVGLVLFKDKCIVPGLAVAMQYGAMFAFLKSFNSHEILKRLAEEA